MTYRALKEVVGAEARLLPMATYLNLSLTFVRTICGFDSIICKK